jgi:pimeloyl-ACP methyl ester carboxylesterase
MDQTILLPDGRSLGFSVYGAADGYPVLYFHGTPSSRLEPRILEGYGGKIEPILLEAGVKLIATDRPGMGLSSFHTSRTLISFAKDVYTLTKTLNISRCSVMGWSGGGPYALAMAHQYPELIKDVFILCGFSIRFTPKLLLQMGRNKWYFGSAKYFPWLLEFTLSKISRSTASHSLPQWLSGLPDIDYQLLKDTSRLQLISATTLKEACHSGPKGPVHDAQVYFKDFGFKLADIQQPVHFWWGTKDNAVIRPHAEAVEQQITNNVLHYKEGEGHLSVYVHFFREVLQLISSLK